ncbi:MAG: transposase [Deltaproteobacteria bacterium]|nr:transposase [Deltaproteobacteria bacterium]
MRKSSAPLQLSFDDIVRWGGKRENAGRKVVGRPRVGHVGRETHKYWVPMFVTVRGAAGLPSFRTPHLYSALEKAVRTTRRADFRIVEFSVQDNHLHLIIEADDEVSRARGMKSFTVRANRLVNAASGRGRGAVWDGRYHFRELGTAREVRNALVYCLQNYKKHYGVARGVMRIDPCSSARWFTGWSVPRTCDDGPRPTELAKTVLLDRAWRKHGLIDPGETPKASRVAR